MGCWPDVDFNLSRTVLSVIVWSDVSFRGSIYRRNADLREGWLAIVQGWLLFRPKEFDDEPSSMCYILDTMSLQVRYISQ